MLPSRADDNLLLTLPTQNILIIVSDHHDTSSRACALVKLLQYLVNRMTDILKLIHQNAAATTGHLLAKSCISR